MDMPDRPGQLYGALVLAKAKPYSVIASIDAAAALVRRESVKHVYLLSDFVVFRNYRVLWRFTAQAIYLE